VVRRSSRLRVGVYVVVQLLLLLAGVIFLHRQRRLRKSSIVAVREDLRWWWVLWWRQKVLNLFHAVLEVFCRAVEVLLAFFLALDVLVSL
jgi:hypothetical protein